VVKAEGRLLRRPFFIHAPFIWIKTMEQKEIIKCSNLPGIVACAVIPLMGGWTLRTPYKKSSFITKDKHEGPKKFFYLYLFLYPNNVSKNPSVDSKIIRLSAIDSPADDSHDLSKASSCHTDQRSA
jgi:hypothetical protein